jgi:pantothenate kinase
MFAALSVAFLLGLAVPPPADVRMARTYSALAERLIVRASTRPADQPLWVGVAGGPGAGKSTLTAAVAAIINERLGAERCVVLPMDGFHFSRAELKALDPPAAASYMPRRGAPWTFDAEGCFASLSAAKAAGRFVLPTYSREIEDPVPGGVELAEEHSIVLVEGLYLLMRSDPRWAPLSDLWDEAWFISCKSSAEQRRRLVARHLETWDDEETVRWGPGEPAELAAKRADANDVLNAELVRPCAEFADVIIESK